MLSRFEVFCSMVSSIIITGRSELAKMARGQDQRKQHASKVKQYKRWLLNEKNDYETYYLPYISDLLVALSKSGLLIFSIDGSSIGRSCMCLMISVIYKDKAIPVIWKTYKAKKGHLSELNHRELLSSLAQLVPSNCKVTMTGDGEFDGCDWQSDILDLGWDYVLKTSKNTWIKDANDDEFVAAYALPDSGASIFFEQVEFTKKRHTTNLLVWLGKGFKQALFLVTNLDYPPLIKQLYKKRFKIEPFFRDQKSHGFHIHKSGLSDPMRLDKLLLATCMAYVICIMAGIKACQSKFYAEFSRTDEDFLSLFSKGYYFILFLVDIRQWRAFSIRNDLKPQFDQLGDLNICVPF